MRKQFICKKILNMTQSKIPPNLNIGKDVKEAFKVAGILDAYNNFPPSHQKEWLKWIEEAKKPETRVKRIHKTIESLKINSK
jgi:uncharacterized protein YdeI (YjbR/CyaY-like superfamily)